MSWILHVCVAVTAFQEMSCAVASSAIDITTLNTTQRAYASLKGNEELNRLRFCDPRTPSKYVHFAPHPRCPHAADHAQDHHETGTVITFKRNIQATRTDAMACQWFVSYRKTYTGWFFHKFITDQWDRPMEPPSEQECQKWRSTRDCTINGKTHMLYFVSMSHDGYVTYSSKIPVQVKFDWWSWGKDPETYTHNCIMKEVYVVASPPYQVVHTSLGMAQNLSRTGARSFELGSHIITDEWMIIWHKVEPTMSCGYVLAEIHHNVTKVKLGDGKGRFYLVLEEAKQMLTFDRQTHMIPSLSAIDHPYCVSKRLSTMNYTEMYWDTYYGIVSWIPDTVPVSSIEGHLNHSTVHLNVSVVNHDHLCEEYKRKQHADAAGTAAFNCTHYLSRRRRAVDSATRSEMLLISNKIMENVRYFVSGKIVDWMSSQQRQRLDTWCAQSFYDHNMARALAVVNPSAVLSVYLGRDVYAKPRGSIYEISRCRFLNETDFRLARSLEVGEGKSLCYSRPLIYFNGPADAGNMTANITGIHDWEPLMGQAMDDGRIVIPPKFTESCRYPNFLRFYINEVPLTYKNYTLITLPDENGTETDFALLSDMPSENYIRDMNYGYIVDDVDPALRDVSDFLPPIEADVPIMENPYTDEEIANQLDLMSILEDANQMRIFDRHLRWTMAMYQMYTTNDPDLAKIASDIINGIGSVVGGIGSAVGAVFNGAFDFFGRLVAGILGFLGTLAGKIIAFILGIMVGIGGVYAFFVFITQLTAFTFRAGRGAYNRYSDRRSGEPTVVIRDRRSSTSSSSSSTSSSEGDDEPRKGEKAQLLSPGKVTKVDMVNAEKDMRGRKWYTRSVRRHKVPKWLDVY